MCGYKADLVAQFNESFSEEATTELLYWPPLTAEANAYTPFLSLHCSGLSN